MFVEDLLVVFGCFLFCVERSKVARGLYYVVREPLVPASGEECVSKVIWLLFTGGAVTKVGGRTALQKRKQEREFNPTRGYPGEDILLGIVNSSGCDISVIPVVLFLSF